MFKLREAWLNSLDSGSSLKEVLKREGFNVFWKRGKVKLNRIQDV